MQPLAERKFINKLNGFIDKGMNGIELVELAIEKNWLSVYPNDYRKPKVNMYLITGKGKGKVENLIY